MKWQIYPQHIIIAACIAAISTNADGHSSQGPDRKISIDIEAMTSQSAARFAKIDTNGDGQIDSTEFAAIEMRRPNRAKPGKRAHRAGPGKRAHRAGPGKRAHRAKSRFSQGGPRAGFSPRRLHLPDPDAVFNMADENGDKQLSRKEFKLLPVAMKKIAQKPLFSRLDANDDGALTKDEFPPMRARLKKLDANGDGKLTRDELPARNQFRQMRRRGLGK